jgi:hypothetical protein
MSVSDQDRRSAAAEALEALPGLARLTASLWWHSTGWALQKSASLSWRLLETAGSPTYLATGLRRIAGGALQDIADAIDLDDRGGAAAGAAAAAADVARRVADAVPIPSLPDSGSGNGASGSNGANGQHARSHGDGGASRRSLQEEGAQLLARSRDVHYEFDAHPAYERILSELAPDEARILRLMLLEGPQASVDVRTGGPVGLVKSHLLAPGLSMIGARAGCRYIDRVPSYLNNLFRLGLVWFSRETLNDPLRYQVLEAQPDVVEAVHSVSYAKIVRRSIHLTPFGEDFCRVCLSSDEATLEELPIHSPPPEHGATPQPPKVTDL